MIFLDQSKPIRKTNIAAENAITIMSNLIRIVLGLAVMVGAWLITRKAQPVEGSDTTLLLMGRELAPSTLNLLVVAFGLIGLVMVVIGILGLKKAR